MKLCYLIRTNALDSDERFVKTCQFLGEVGETVIVFGVVKRKSRIDGENIQKQLRLRTVFGSGQFLVLKYFELLVLTASFLLNHRGRRWFANFDFLPLQFISTALSSQRLRPIWDLHEMPPNAAMRNPLLRWIFAFMLRRSHVIVCNRARLIALENAFGVDLSSALVLRNTPGKKAFDRLLALRSAHLSKVTPDADLCNIIITGGNAPGRYVRESVEVIKELRHKTGRNLQVTLVGGAPLHETYDFVTSTDFISFDNLVERCVQGGISLCFYQMNSLNNTLCEPNRFYQGLLAGQYLLSFDHPSLNDLSYTWHITVAEKDFHEDLSQALARILAAPVDPRNRLAVAFRDGVLTLNFENQLPLFKAWYPPSHSPVQ